MYFYCSLLYLMFYAFKQCNFSIFLLYYTHRLAINDSWRKYTFFTFTKNTISSNRNSSCSFFVAIFFSYFFVVFVIFNRKKSFTIYFLFCSYLMQTLFLQLFNNFFFHNFVVISLYFNIFYQFMLFILFQLFFGVIFDNFRYFD